MGNWFAKTPGGLGVKNGRLAACPDSPNCVCSQEERESHHVAAFTFEGEATVAFLRLIEVLKTWPRTRIVEQTDRYLHVEFTTPILRFVDDGEFLLSPEEHVIQVRSAARLGSHDFGVNRRRMEKLRKAFQSASSHPAR